MQNEKFHNIYDLPNIICDKIKKDNMGGACSTGGRDEKFIENFGRKA
jgi:hypothetical protein